MPEGAIDPNRLRAMLQRAYAIRAEDERRISIAAIWHQFLSQTNPPPPPRFFLAELLVDLYEKGGEPGRAALVEIALFYPAGWLMDHAGRTVVAVPVVATIVVIVLGSLGL